jgi:multiple sugar transport system ATP-binding protein
MRRDIVAKSRAARAGPQTGSRGGIAQGIMSAVRFSEVWKYYGTVEAVRDLNLICEDGEMLALLGPSGCGKSTTLKMAAGIEEVSHGDIFFDQYPVSRLAPGARNIAMVFEDYALYPHLTVFENISFPLKLRRQGSAEIARRVDPVIALLGLDEMRHDNVRALSGGAQQRISIGRALVRDPQLILFDEPLSHLDADQKIQLRAEIKRLQQTTGLTAILVTHDQTEAVAMSDRVAVMNHGVLQQVATPRTLYDAPANLFVANFIGEPPMNLLPAEIARIDGQAMLEGAGWRAPVPPAIAARLEGRAGALVMGIRPEHVALAQHGDNAAAATGVVFYREPRGDGDIVLVRLAGGHGGGGGGGGADDALITAETAEIARFDAGQPVAVELDGAHMIVFDAASGANVMAA